MAGPRHRPPAGFAQAIPGAMTMFTLLIMLTGDAALLVACSLAPGVGAARTFRYQ